MTHLYSQSAWLIPLLPFISFLFLIALGKGNQLAGKLIGISSLFLTLVLSTLVLTERLDANATEYNHHFTWLTVGPYALQIGFEITNTIAFLLVVISAIGLLVYIYAADYLSNDERATVLFGYLSLLMFALLGLTIADNLFMFYVLWDIAGIAAWLLITFWVDRPLSHHRLATPTFMLIKLGDVCLLLAVVVLLFYMPDHSVNFTMIQNVFHGSGSVVTMKVAITATLLIIVAIASRTFQFPFYISTPAIAAAPLPVYALVFGGMMALPAIFLVIRMLPVMEVAASLSSIAIWFAIVTMLLSALLALGTKRASHTLIYLAMNQISFLLLGAITGAVQATVLYSSLFVFVQTILYLTYRYNSRWTKIAFVAAALSYMAIPPIAPFWTKSIILQQLWEEKPSLAMLAIVASSLTFIALVRLVRHIVAPPTSDTEALERRQEPVTATVQVISLVTILVIAAWTMMEMFGLQKVGAWLEVFQYQWQEWFVSPWQQPVVWINLVATVLACVVGFSWKRQTQAAQESNLVEVVVERQFYTKDILYYLLVWPYQKLGWLLITITLLLVLWYGKGLL
ncbi:proton-conducting transporter membrane subunit [Paenibacillus yanchengensis]|uniref:Proton-conducting transporter membrane subunit n=1 Tax=Paenibacillus yanchengensis TaxID=2035833 RepID=A0ABW4YMT1_9BACL